MWKVRLERDGKLIRTVQARYIAPIVEEITTDGSNYYEVIGLSDEHKVAYARYTYSRER